MARPPLDRLSTSNFVPCTMKDRISWPSTFFRTIPAPARGPHATGRALCRARYTAYLFLGALVLYRGSKCVAALVVLSVPPKTSYVK